eukprot:3134583-Prymnesium_polylepis.1
MRRRTSRKTESTPDEYHNWSTEMSVSWKWGEPRTPRSDHDVQVTDPFALDGVALCVNDGVVARAHVDE